MSINKSVEVEGKWYDVEFEYYGDYASMYHKDDYHLVSIRELNGTAELLDEVDEEFQNETILALEGKRQDALEEDKAYEADD